MPSKNFQFGKQYIGDDHPCFIIAEIGINHEGDLDTCMQMVKACADAGANAAKIQTSDPDENYHPDSESYAIYKQSFLGPESTDKVFKYARSLGLEVFTTTGLRTLEWVEKLNPSGYKISSGLIGHWYLVKQTLQKGRPIILSTGLSEYQDIDDMVEIFNSYELDDYAILQCTSLYPCPDEHINLSAINEIGSRYDVIAGLSDHSVAIDVPAYAVSAGAKIIEKHFTLDIKRPGFDHPISLDFQGFKDMVRLIRRAETLYGTDNRRLAPQVKEKKQKMERRIFSAQKLTKGKALSIDDLLFLRTERRDIELLSASKCESLIGKTLLEDVSALEPIRKNNVEN